MRSRHQIFAAIAIAALLLSGCAQELPPEKGPRRVVVEAPEPLVGPGGAQEYPGTVRARNETTLSFRIGGKISERHVELGSRVKAGEVIAELDAEDARLNLQAAKAAVSAAEADVKLAGSEARRYRDLKAKGHVGQSAVDLRENTLNLAEARLDQARSQLDLARNQSSYTRLRSDTAGVVTQVLAEPGNVVTAGQPVVQFAPDGEREVRIAVPEGQINNLQAAAAMQISIYSRPGETFNGRIRDITPQADQATRTHEARVTLLDVPEDLPLGATASVIAVLPSDGRTFQVRPQALGNIDDEQPVVWKLAGAEDGEPFAEPLPVEIVRYLESAVIIKADLSAEDRLITAGVHRLRPGMPVIPIERSAEAAL